MARVSTSLLERDGSGPGLLFWRLRVAEVICDDVECGEEGVHIDHEGSVPFPWGSGSKPTLKGGHLPLKSSIHNSHQAFKEGVRALSPRRAWRWRLLIFISSTPPAARVTTDLCRPK